jgi:hypothetical protein
LNVPLTFCSFSLLSLPSSLQPRSWGTPISAVLRLFLLLGFQIQSCTWVSEPLLCWGKFQVVFLSLGFICSWFSLLLLLLLQPPPPPLPSLLVFYFCVVYLNNLIWCFPFECLEFLDGFLSHINVYKVPVAWFCELTLPFCYCPLFIWLLGWLFPVVGVVWFCCHYLASFIV